MKIFLSLLILITIISFKLYENIPTTNVYTKWRQELSLHLSLPISKEVSIKELIFNVGGQEALEIAWCESRYDPLAENPNSSASGLFQFTSGTWENYCHGDVFNAKDNIECFKKLYPLHKSWWKCKAT